MVHAGRCVLMRGASDAAVVYAYLMLIWEHHALVPRGGGGMSRNDQRWILACHRVLVDELDARGLEAVMKAIRRHVEKRSRNLAICNSDRTIDSAAPFLGGAVYTARP